jgi:hypothetical protein
VLPIAPPGYVDKGLQLDVNLRIVSSFAGDALAAVPFATDHPEAELRLVQSALSEIILTLVRGVPTRGRSRLQGSRVARIDCGRALSREI